MSNKASKQPSKQAEYSIHQDDGADEYLTCVYLLSQTSSSLQVVGGDLCEFDGRGSGWGFLSKTWHGTGVTALNTLKLAAFWVRKPRGAQAKGCV